MRTKSRANGPVVPGTISSATVSLVRRSSDSSSSSGASSRRRPLVRRIDSRTKKLAVVNAEVARLTQHVRQLQQLRDLLREKTMSQAETAAGSILRTVRMYFDVFRHGYQPQAQTLHAGSMISNEAFLFSVVDEDVVGGGFRGVRTLEEQWKRYTQLFGGPQLRLLDYGITPLEDTEDGDGKVSVSVTVTHSGHVTLKTIELLFPHVMSDAALVMSMLGRPISGDGHAQFIFDCQAGRIVELRLDLDMPGTFARIVEKPSDLAMLFKLAQLTPDYFLGEKNCNAPSEIVSTAVEDVTRDEVPPESEPLTPTESSARSRDDPMTIKSILTVEDVDWNCDAAEIRAVSGID